MKPPIAFTVNLGAFVFCPLKLNLKYAVVVPVGVTVSEPTEATFFK